jgi:uncharacterized short protein YbdD (DUF466 family)
MHLRKIQQYNKYIQHEHDRQVDKDVKTQKGYSYEKIDNR